MFNFIKQSLYKIYTGVTTRLTGLFGYATIDTHTLEELETILLAADTGTTTTKKILSLLKESYDAGTLTEGSALRHKLESILLNILRKASGCISPSSIIVMVGINGSGKTTCAGKLAYMHAQQGKKVLLVAADTFRAAASEQLQQWATMTGVALERSEQGQDPASIVFKGCERFKKEHFDILIIDTAGRLHTKVNLMHELAKIKRIITRQFPHHSIDTLLTIDGMLGQNSFEQAKLFKEATEVNGIILTKMDGTGKGGIIFAIMDILVIPIWYITYGEQMNQLKVFQSDEYVRSLLQT